MNAKEWEALCLRSCRVNGEATAARYGTVSCRLPGGEVVERKSLPDIEGVLVTGRQFVFDCKYVSGPSLNVTEFRQGGRRKRQLDHLRERSRYNAICGFAIYFAVRTLARSVQPEMLAWLPVECGDLWDLVSNGEISRIHRDEVSRLGVEIPWVHRPRWKYPRPGILQVIRSLV